MVTYHRVQVEDCKGQSVRTVVFYVLFFLIYYRFLSFCGIFIKWNRINDKSNSKNRILLSNFAPRNLKKRTEERD